ncbi:hypothetical protein ACIGO8_06295 [Streptomyces sp. NPDC053493]|uniref:hypothetical protein n=1 Tax=Streptomyces sp. NPDC053493 TaxID=3365705 RepID=UPI0037CF4DBD
MSQDETSAETEGAAERFAHAADWLRRELRSVAGAVAATGVERRAEPRAEERTEDRRTVYGAVGKRFSLVLTLPDTPFEPAAAAARAVFEAAGWETAQGEGSGGLVLLKAWRDGFEAGVGIAGGALRITGSTPVVRFHARWVRPPRVVGPDTLWPGHRLCVTCDGWGSCRTCEGLGFVNGRRCAECGLGMDCPDCRGTGQEPAPDRS